MDFKEFYLIENPYTSMREFTFKCPYTEKHSEDDPIITTKDEYLYDMFAEHMPKKYGDPIMKLFWHGVKPPFIPFMCKKDGKVFIWEPNNNNITRPANNDEEVMYCRMHIEALGATTGKYIRYVEDYKEQEAENNDPTIRYISSKNVERARSQNNINPNKLEILGHEKNSI